MIFDQEQFRADVVRWIKTNGYGSRERLGNRNAVQRLLSKSGKVRSIDSIVSIAGTCGLRLDDYVKPSSV